MSDIAISIRGLGKQYRLGAMPQAYGTLRDSLAGLFRKSADHGSRGRETFWALRDVSFDVPRGQVLGVIGANGAGKSTLLKILSRVTEPTEGEVRIRGRVSSLLEVGTGFHPELTGRENIYLSGQILGMDRQEVTRKFDEIVAFSGVEKFIDTPLKRFSSGMNVRLGFAVAAHLDPEILIVDEVLAVGDAEFQRKCIGRMKDVSQEGRTVFFVSHNMASIGQLCDRSIFLDKGSVAFDGPIEGAIAMYNAAGDRTATFVQTESKSDVPAYIDHVSVIDHNDEESNLVDWAEPFQVEVGVTANEDVSATVMIRLESELGVLLSKNYACDSIGSLTTLKQRKSVNFRARFPAGVLNAGSVRLMALLLRSNQEVIDKMVGPPIRIESITPRTSILGSRKKDPSVLQGMATWTLN